MKKIPSLHVIGVFLIWFFFTFVLSLIKLAGKNVQLIELVSKKLSYPLMFAALTLFIYMIIANKKEVFGFKFNNLKFSWILFYPIMILVLGFFINIYTGVFNHVNAYIYVLINTFFVGISEELMFRGLLLTSFVRKYGFWKGAILISLLFGSIHVLNGFVTGDFTLATIQAVVATLSGFLFLALRVKSLNIVIAIFFHWMWDFTVFLISNNKLTESTSADDPVKILLTVIIPPILLISPLIFFGTALKELLKKQVVTNFMETQLDNAIEKTSSF